MKLTTFFITATLSCVVVTSHAMEITKRQTGQGADFSDSLLVDDTCEQAQELYKQLTNLEMDIAEFQSSPFFRLPTDMGPEGDAEHRSFMPFDPASLKEQAERKIEILEQTIAKVINPLIAMFSPNSTAYVSIMNRLAQAQHNLNELKSIVAKIMGAL